MCIYKRLKVCICTNYYFLNDTEKEEAHISRNTAILVMLIMNHLNQVLQKRLMKKMKEMHRRKRRKRKKNVQMEQNVASRLFDICDVIFKTCTMVQN